MHDQYFRDRASRDQFSWSTSIGRWLGVPVRVHACLFLFVALIFAIQGNFIEHNEPVFSAQGTAIATSLILVLSILLHELAHVFAATNLGGAVRSIMLAPWGGDTEIELPIARRSQAIVFAAGPFANLMVFLCGMTLLVQSGQSSFVELVNPFRPHGLEGDWTIAFAKIITWVNFQIFWINMIPVHPLDASHLVRIAITVKNSTVEREKVEAGVLIIGLAASVIVLAMAWLARDVQQSPIQPGWAILVLGGIVLLFSARHGYYLYSRPSDEDDWDELVEELDEEYNGYYDENDDYFAYEDADSISQWLQEKQEAREQIEREIEAEEERRVDSILEKLHASGIDSLDDDEKSLLQRVSDRYRRRNRQQPS